MAPFASIYSYPQNFRVKRALVLAAFNGLEIDVPQDFEMMVTNTQPDYLSKFPLGKVPTMETADGLHIAESGAICAHIAGSGPLAEQLLGATPAARAKVWQWSFFAEAELVNNMNPVFLGCTLKLMPIDQNTYNNSAAGFDRALGALEAELKKGNGKFLVGDKFSMADVMVAGALYFSTGFLYDVATAEKFPTVTKYLEGLSEVAEFKNVFNEFKPAGARATL